jgi:hypothetical protein
MIGSLPGAFTLSGILGDAKKQSETVGQAEVDSDQGVKTI